MGESFASSVLNESVDLAREREAVFVELLLRGP